MRNRKIYLPVLLAVSVSLAALTGGCSMLKKPDKTEPETTKVTETEKITEKVTEKVTESELETNVAYTSQDRSVRIILPDSTWKVTQDADEMRVFSSGAAMISIVHAADESQMRNVPAVATTQEELNESLTRQSPEADSFEIQSFEAKTSDTLNTYEYVVKYNATSMWAYAVTYGIMAEKEAYVVSGTVTDDNPVLLDAVKKSVESFAVLENPTFSVKPEDAGKQSETQQSEKPSGDNSGELQSLTDYDAEKTLYASDNVNVRMEPSTESADNIMFSLVPGQQVTVVGETDQWYKVKVDGNTGYVSRQFLSSEPVSSTQTEAPDDENEVTSDTKLDAEKNSQINYDSSYTYYTTAGINLRAEPGTDAGIIGSLATGDAVTIVGETANWFVVSVNGTKAYVSKSYITSTSPSTEQTNANNGDGANEQTDANNGGTNNQTEANNGGTNNQTEANNGGSADGQNGTNTGNGGSQTVISGTVTGVGADTITIAGDDGTSHTVSMSDVAASAGDVYEGLYVTVNVNSSTTAN